MKIEDINQIIPVASIRLRINCDDKNDTSMDKHIESLSSQRLVELWSAYQLGDESWARGIIGAYESLKEMEKNNG